jgi:hypothetical protein
VEPPVVLKDRWIVNAPLEVRLIRKDHWGFRIIGGWGIVHHDWMDQKLVGERRMVVDIRGCDYMQDRVTPCGNCYWDGQQDRATEDGTALETATQRS